MAVSACSSWAERSLSQHLAQVLNHFGEIDADLLAKQKYAVWKAGDIRLALKQGRRPMAGSPADQTIAFRPGSKVYFAAEPTGAMQPGTVAKVELIDGQQVFTVALKDTFVQAPVENLALDVNAGDQVLYRGQNGEVLATVEAMDLQHWPPSYVVKLADGSVKDTGPDRVLSAPPKASTVPPPPPPANSVPAPPPPQAASDAPPPPASARPPPPSSVPLPPPPAAAPPPPRAPAYPPPASAYPPPAAAHASSPATPAVPKPAMPQATAGYTPSGSRIAAAKKLAKSAASSLDFDDVQTSIKLLNDALQLLTDPNKST
mmetsp:Transcript_16693/g.46638  ORF Transcript_16693/g.46638 Transcript_16693/m.46638 type:complete len:317 (+) Transcript_16693:645-1595(+)